MWPPTVEAVDTQRDAGESLRLFAFRRISVVCQSVVSGCCTEETTTEPRRSCYFAARGIATTVSRYAVER